MESTGVRTSTAHSTTRVASPLLEKPAKLPGQKKKFQYVSPTIDTGSSVKEIQRKQEAKNYVKKPGEIFQRIRTKTLAQFIEEQDEAQYIAAYDSSNSLNNSNNNSDSMFGSKEEEPVPKPKNTAPYILLDVRDKELFDKCTIRGALHYPHTMLSRSTNEFTAEIIAYRNVKDKYIIVFDEDESISAKVATTMFQKGIDNILLLSGGLRDMFEKFPLLVTGELPPKPGTAKSLTGSRPSSTSSNNSLSSVRSFSSVKSGLTAKTGSSQSSAKTSGKTNDTKLSRALTSKIGSK